MLNPIRVRTNTHSSRHFDVYLYQDEEIFKKDEDFANKQDWEVLYSGNSTTLLTLKPRIKVGARVSFISKSSVGEVSRKFGVVNEIYENNFVKVVDEEGLDQSIFIKSLSLADVSFTDLASMFIKSFTPYNYYSYNLEPIGGRMLTFATAEQSLSHLVQKSNFVIMIAKEIVKYD